MSLFSFSFPCLLLFVEKYTKGHSYNDELQFTPKYPLIFLTEENKVTEVVDESDKELIRVAREDVEDDEPKKKTHKEKKRSTEGKPCQANFFHTKCLL